MCVVGKVAYAFFVLNAYFNGLFITLNKGHIPKTSVFQKCFLVFLTVPNIPSKEKQESSTRKPSYEWPQGIDE